MSDNLLGPTPDPVLVRRRPLKRSNANARLVYADHINENQGLPPLEVQQPLPAGGKKRKLIKSRSAP